MFKKVISFLLFTLFSSLLSLQAQEKSPRYITATYNHGHSGIPGPMIWLSLSLYKEDKSWYDDLFDTRDTDEFYCNPKQRVLSIYLDNKDELYELKEEHCYLIFSLEVLKNPNLIIKVDLDTKTKKVIRVLISNNNETFGVLKTETHIYFDERKSGKDLPTYKRWKVEKSDYKLEIIPQ